MSPRSSSNDTPLKKTRPSARRLDGTERLLALGIAGAFLFLFLLASFLHPDSRGYGTHEHFYLPPCFTRALLGIPCPFCGMTTAFVLMAHGQIHAAFVAQPAGALFALAAAFTSFALMFSAFSGWWWQPFSSTTGSKWLFLFILPIIMLAWMYKLVTALSL